VEFLLDRVLRELRSDSLFLVNNSWKSQKHSTSSSSTGWEMVDVSSCEKSSKNGDVIKKHVGFERSEFHQQISKHSKHSPGKPGMVRHNYQELFGQAISIIVNPLTWCWFTPHCAVGRW
jgi:hypothetical protein